MWGGVSKRLTSPMVTLGWCMAIGNNGMIMGIQAPRMRALRDATRSFQATLKWYIPMPPDATHVPRNKIFVSLQEGGHSIPDLEDMEDTTRDMFKFIMPVFLIFIHVNVSLHVYI